jgi:hypothetical protein
MNEIEALKAIGQKRGRDDSIFSLIVFGANPAEKWFARDSLRNGITAIGPRIPWHQT